MEDHRDIPGHLVPALAPAKPASSLFPRNQEMESLQQKLKTLQEQLLAHGRSIFGTENLDFPASSHEHMEADDRPAPESPLPQPPATQPRKRPPQRDRSEVIALRAQLMQDREELTRLRAMQGIAEDRLNSRISRLEDKARQLAGRTKALERRRAADAQGWQSELTALRQRLAVAERRQRKISLIRTLPDDDTRDAVLARHQKLEELEAGEPIGRGHGCNFLPNPDEDFQGSLEALSSELGALRFALGGLERRLT